MEKNKSKFNALTPEILETNNPIYTEALDYAFSNDDIKNIAITGIYGAGKSSVWRTYIEHKTKVQATGNAIFNFNLVKRRKRTKKIFRNVITISIGKYMDEYDNARISEADNNQELDNRVEKQIINQILAQIKDKNIPFSKYRIKRNLSWFELSLRTLLSFSFISSIFMWINRDTIPMMLNGKLKDFYDRQELNLLLLSFSIPLIIFLFRFFKENKFNLTRVNFKGAEAIFKDEKHDETILDKDIREIVYLLKHSDSKIIVFEDLDRYDNVEIFTKLRELNFLLNSYIHAQKERKIVRFVYLIKDSLFSSKDRTKFFDFILPIVPVIDSSNSENKLIEAFSCFSESPSDLTLSKISLYIDDMRLLKNIVNEYIIYKNVIPINKLKLNQDKLFALIVLKNIFPEEFELLQSDKGYIYSVFSKIKQEKLDSIGQLQTQIDNLKKELNTLKRKNIISKFEFLASKIPVNIRLKDLSLNQTWGEFLEHQSKLGGTFKIENNGSSYDFTYEDFLKTYILKNDEIKRSYEEFLASLGADVLDLEQSIELNEKEKTQMLSKSIRDVLLSKSEEDLNIFFRNILDMWDEKIIKSHYFPLIRFLIIEGLIDQSYIYYKGYFYKESLSVNDTIFLKNIYEVNPQEFNYPLENVGKVINKLSDEDFGKPNILNKDLIEYCLDKNFSKEIIRVIESVDLNERYDDFVLTIKSIEAKRINKLIHIIAPEQTRFILKILDRLDIVYKSIIISSVFTIENINVNLLRLYANHVKKDSKILHYIDKKDLNSFFNNILYANIKFDKLDDWIGDKELLEEWEYNRVKEIATKKLYSSTVDNVKFLCEWMFSSKSESNYKRLNIEYGKLIEKVFELETLIFNNNENPTGNDEILEFVKQYIDNNPKDGLFSNNVSTTKEILKLELPLEYKLKYLEFNETKIDNISFLFSNQYENDELVTKLLEKNTIQFTRENIDFLFDNGYDNQDFMLYIKKNINKSNNNSILKGNEKLCKWIINSSYSSDEAFDYSMKYIDFKLYDLSFNSITTDRMRKLIENDLISLELENIQRILAYSKFSPLKDLIQEKVGLF